MTAQQAKNQMKAVVEEQRAKEWEHKAIAAAQKGDYQNAALCWRYAATEYRNALCHHRMGEQP